MAIYNLEKALLIRHYDVIITDLGKENYIFGLYSECLILI